MWISLISDVHAGKTDHSHYQLLLKFLDHPKTRGGRKVVLLGDVFDHLTGEHMEYGNKYRLFFDKLGELLQSGVEVVFVEGNHDFHFERTCKNLLRSRVSEEELGLFSYVRGIHREALGEKKAVFCHGDQMDESNTSYKRWKNVYTSKAFGFFISRILNFKQVESIGNKAANNSRKRGSKNFDSQAEKAKYRAAAEELVKRLDCDVLVAGHTHIPDEYLFGEKAYYNIGFPPREKSFLTLSESKAERVPLL